MKKKYYGNWGANNSSRGDGYIFTNLRTACKTMRAIALGNTFQGNTGWWRVCNHDGDCEHQDCGIGGQIRR